MLLNVFNRPMTFMSSGGSIISPVCKSCWRVIKSDPSSIPDESKGKSRPGKWSSRKNKPLAKAPRTKDAEQKKLPRSKGTRRTKGIRGNCEGRKRTGKKTDSLRWLVRKRNYPTTRGLTNDIKKKIGGMRHEGKY